jgi:hypothetical protein
MSPQRFFATAITRVLLVLLVDLFILQGGLVIELSGAYSGL